jgi:glycosyltransferase involved in cell wall biosynthesis
MKIAIYVHDMRASGVVRAMMALARFLAENGDDVTLVAGLDTGHLRSNDISPARLVTTARPLIGPLPRLRLVPGLRRTIGEIAPNVILSGGNHGHVSIWAATRGLGIPLVFTFSNPMQRRNQPLRSAWRVVKARCLVAASVRSIVAGRNLAADPAFAPGVAQGKVAMIRNGIDLDAARHNQPCLVPTAMAGPDATVLTIGRWHPQKNLEGLIDAVGYANGSRRLRLVILGGGKDAYRERLLRRARQRGIEDRVDFAGVTDDVYPWLRSADVFAIASWWEAASLALFEALAAGVPIVASTAAGDARDVLDDGRYGVLADPGDPVAFGEALLRQIGEDRIYPGKRAEAYDAATMLAAYRDLLIATREAEPLSGRPR